MSKKIISVDFDGVLHSYTSGWKGADVITDPPVDMAIPWLVEATKHFDVHIFSTRSHQEGGIAAMQKWLVAPLEKYTEEEFPHGFSVDAEHFVMHRLKWPTTKPPALVMIDDRAICFRGTFPSMETLKNFKPWNKP